MILATYGQDLFQQPIELGPNAATATAAAPPGGRSAASFFVTAVAAGVTTWLLTRFLDRLLLRKR